MGQSDIRIRRATPDDVPAVIEVATVALGWERKRPNEELFMWKHVENPFGASPMWVAEADGRVAGFRAFMRWELVDGTGKRVKAVRAVDTATHPDFQRRGIFSSLTQRGVEEMIQDAVHIVFNTPNTQSRPGYLKLGWVDAGRLPAAFRPTGVRSFWHIARARTAAQKWSEPSHVGKKAPVMLADGALQGLVASQPPPKGLSTKLSAEWLRWRYRLEPLQYRVWAPDGVEDGIVVFRVRRRGDARECAIGTVLTPGGNKRRARKLVSGLAKQVDADYLLRLGATDLRNRFFALPGQGPRLTVREVTTVPPADVDAWQLQLGDIELF